MEEFAQRRIYLTALCPLLGRLEGAADVRKVCCDVHLWGLFAVCLYFLQCKPPAFGARVKVVGVVVPAAQPDAIFSAAPLFHVACVGPCGKMAL